MLIHNKNLTNFETPKKKLHNQAVTNVGISSGQRNLMKTYHNEANTGGITKIASKNVLEFFG
jgi:hypothetical protein